MYVGAYMYGHTLNFYYIKQKLIKFYFICMGVLSVYHMYMWGLEERVGYPGTNLQMDVSYHVAVGS